MKLVEITFGTLLVTCLCSCVNEGAVNVQDNRIIDGYFDSSLTTESDNWDSVSEYDSIVTIRSKCSDDSLYKFFSFEIDFDDSEFSGRKLRKVISIKTNKKDGEVLNVNVLEKEYSERHRHFLSKSSYAIENDSCSVKSQNININIE